MSMKLKGLGLNPQEMSGYPQRGLRLNIQPQEEHIFVRAESMLVKAGWLCCCDLAYLDGT